MGNVLLKYSKKYSLKFLSEGNFKRSSGRSRGGKLLVRARGSGISHRLRIVDFYRGIWNISAVVIGIEYTSYLYPPVACLSYYAGIMAYIRLVAGLRIGSTITSGFLSTPAKIGNSSILLSVPINRHISTVGFLAAQAAVFSRAACTYSKIIKKKKFQSYILLKSGIIKTVSPFANATYGIIYKPSFVLNGRIFSKAGHARRLGFRPKVRGVAMNPVDHPHGGGEGKKSAKASPRNVWGFMFKDKRTANN